MRWVVEMAQLCSMSSMSHATMYLFVCLSVCVSIHLSVAHLPIHPTVRSFFVYPSIYLVFLSTDRLSYLSVTPST